MWYGPFFFDLSLPQTANWFKNSTEFKNLRMKQSDHIKIKSRILKKLIIILCICTFIILTAAFFFIRSIYQYAETPCSSNTKKILFSVHPGQNIHAAARQLQERNIIKSPFKLRVLSRIRGLDRRLKVGEYPLSPSMTPNEILDIIVSGKSMLYRVTVPEGYNLFQVSQVIEKSGLATFDHFYQAATDPDLTREIGIPADTFEGYLFPDTYLFSKETTPRKIITAMVNRFQEMFTENWNEQAKRLGFTIHEIVTLASIIEKETGVPDERKMIASVFHNRLQKKMRLESDPTVIYAIPDFNGNLTRKHLQTVTPYNTYKIRGLPPGPIANPGKKALEAALYPAEAPYLFFVAKRDRTHHFSTTISEHNKAVRKYQIRRR